MAMYCIGKYKNGWAIINDDTGKSRLLDEREIDAVRQEFPELQDTHVRTIFADQVKSIQKLP